MGEVPEVTARWVWPGTRGSRDLRKSKQEGLRARGPLAGHLPAGVPAVADGRLKRVYLHKTLLGGPVGLVRAGSPSARDRETAEICRCKLRAGSEKNLPMPNTGDASRSVRERPVGQCLPSPTAFRGRWKVESLRFLGIPGVYFQLASCLCSISATGSERVAAPDLDRHRHHQRADQPVLGRELTKCTPLRRCCRCAAALVALRRPS